MKPVLFSASLAALLAAASFSAQARTLGPAPTDTIVVRLPNKAVMTLVVRNAAQLRELKQYQLDSLTSRLATYITQAETAAKAGAADQVTMRFYPDQDQPGKNLPAEVRITTRKPVAGSTETTSKTQVFLNKKFGIVRERDADGESSFHINGRKVGGRTLADSAARAQRRARGAKVYLSYSFGLNTLANATSGNATAGVPSLKQWAFGAGYFNFGFDYAQPLLATSHAKLALTFGPELSVNNLQLKGNNQWVQNGSQTYAEQAPDNKQLNRSTLTLTNLNLPVMLRFKLRTKEGKSSLSAGVGGFGGYRLGSSITTKYQLAGSDYTYTDETSGQLNLNNWQYGLQGEVGFHALRFFARYNLNELFREGQGPKTHLLSFGVRLFGF